MKELIFNSFYFGQGFVVLKELNFTSAELLTPPLGGCGGPEKLIFNSFHFGRMWWS